MDQARESIYDNNAVVAMAVVNLRLLAALDDRDLAQTLLCLALTAIDAASPHNDAAADALCLALETDLRALDAAMVGGTLMTIGGPCRAYETRVTAATQRAFTVGRRVFGTAMRAGATRNELAREIGMASFIDYNAVPTCVVPCT
jgi:hypothetical protein